MTQKEGRDEDIQRCHFSRGRAAKVVPRYLERSIERFGACKCHDGQPAQGPNTRKLSSCIFIFIQPRALYFTKSAFDYSNWRHYDFVDGLQVTAAPWAMLQTSCTTKENGMEFVKVGAAHSYH